MARVRLELCPQHRSLTVGLPTVPSPHHCDDVQYAVLLLPVRTYRISSQLLMARLARPTFLPSKLIVPWIAPDCTRAPRRCARQRTSSRYEVGCRTHS